MASAGGLSSGSGQRGRRRTGRRRWLLAGLLLVPLLEISVIVLVGEWIGPWWTFGTLIALSIVGAGLVRREGVRTWRRLRVAVRSGRPPARELTDAALVLVGGALLLAPGFVTDAIGLLLVLPLTRPLTRGWVQTMVSSRLLGVDPQPRPGRTGPRGSRTGGWGQQTDRQQAPRSRSEDVIEGEIVGEDGGPQGGPSAGAP